MLRRQPPCGRLSPGSPSTASLFHSSVILDRRRGGHWNSNHNVYTRRLRRMHEKQTLLRNVSQYAEHLFQSWRHRDDFFEASARSSWYEQAYWAKAFSRRQKSQWDGYRNPRKKRVQFCDSDDDDDDRTEFWSSSFAGRNGFYWSFCDRGHFRWSQYETRQDSSDWKYKAEQEEEEELGNERSPRLKLAAERRALGLSSSGPLELADVKEAFRTCALRWHPDRHSGSSKVEAEEKFKSCLAAYQSLREKLPAS